MSSKRLTGEVAQLGGVAIEFRNVCFTVKDRLSGNSLDILKNVSGKVGDPPAAHTVDQWRAKVSTSIVACARHSLARPPLQSQSRRTKTHDARVRRAWDATRPHAVTA